MGTCGPWDQGRSERLKDTPPTPKCWAWQGGIQEGGEFLLPSSRAGQGLVRDAWVSELSTDDLGMN